MSAAATYASARADLQSKPWVKWAIALTAALGAILEVIDTSIVNVALNDMQSTLGATLSEIGWVITSYAIANVIIIPLSAWLGDFYGKKRYFVFSMIGFTVASVLCGLAPTLPILVLARVLQGLAGGGLLAKAQSILFETFPRHEQGKAQAVFGIGVIAGPAIGPTLGGYLTTNFDWRWIFFINIPFGIVAVLMALTFLPEDPPHRTVSNKVDWLGIGLLALSLGSVQYFLEKGHDEGWFESPLIIKLFLTAVVGTALFVWRELKIDHPAVDLRVLRHRSLVAGSIYSIVLGISLYGAIFAIPIFAQTILGYTPLQTGTLLFPGAIASAIMMPIMGKLSGRFDARYLIFVGSMILMGTMVVLSTINPLTSREDLYIPLITRGIGTTMMFLPLSLATIGPLPKKDIPAATGFYNLTRQMGGSIGIAMLTTILAQRQEFHAAILSERISQYNPLAVERLQLLTNAFVTRGLDLLSAQQRAIAVVARSVHIQAAVMSFEDIFHVVAMLFVFSIPLVFFLSRGKTSAPVDVH
jgi:DHA2 family multidrug resistance protein